MSSRTASSASMLEWMSETIAVRFMKSSRGHRLQHVELHEVHLLADRLGHPLHEIPLERQERGRGRAHAFPIETGQNAVPADVDQLHLQPVPVEERVD